MTPSKYLPGLYPGIPSPAYHASGGVSITTLKAYADSAEHGKAFEDGIVKIGEETAKFGERFHATILEPDRFEKAYVEKPATYPAPATHKKVKAGKIPIGHPLPWNGNAGFCEEWESSQTREVISFSDMEDFRGMRKKVYEDPIAGPYLRAKGRRELSAFSVDQETGISTRARFDLLTDEHVIIDIKTTQSARPHEFTSQCANLRYHLQARWYQNILRTLDQPCHGFVLIAIEKTAPYSVQCFEFDAEAMEHAKNECARLLKLYQKCHEEKRWPGYVDQDSPYLIKLPKWAMENRDVQDQVIYPMGEISL